MNEFEYNQNTLFYYYERRISDFLLNSKKKEAQIAAFEWLQEYVRPFCITVPWNWKILKKQIASYYFGKIPSIQFHYGEDIERGVDFVKSHPNQNIRCSLHKYNTACHSISFRINDSNLELLSKIRESMSDKDVINIFIECSNSSTTCFRRVSQQYNETVSYEMGYGQAMYVFETERGKHDVAGGNFSNGIWKFEKSTDPMLIEHLKRLVRYHEEFLAIKTRCICYFLGIPQISIEGYFNITTPSLPPKVIDIDLPFDRAFF